MSVFVEFDGGEENSPHAGVESDAGAAGDGVVPAQKKAGPAARVKRIRIANVLGIEELEFEPGTVTVVRGANGTGKTSILKAIKSVVGGGHDATLLRQGAEEGEVVLVLEDDTEVRKRIQPHTSDLKVTHPLYGGISRGATWIKGLTDPLSVNPVDFLTAKNQAAVVLEAVPMAADQSEIVAAFQGTGLDPIEVDDDEHRLHALERARGVLYEERRVINRDVKRLTGHVEELRTTVPEGDFQGAEELHQVIKDQAASIERFSGKRSAAINKIADEKAQELEQLHALKEQAIAEANDEAERASKAAHDAAADKSSAIEQKFTQETAAARERKAEAQVALKQVEAAGRAIEAVQRAESELAQSQGIVDELTRAIGDVVTRKSEAAAAIPISGVQIVDGELRVDDVPFEHVNTAERVRIAVEVARLRAGGLPLICVDGMESLDAEHFEALSAALASADVQAIVTRVTDSPLEVASV